MDQAGLHVMVSLLGGLKCGLIISVEVPFFF